MVDDIMYYLTKYYKVLIFSISTIAICIILFAPIALCNSEAYIIDEPLEVILYINFMKEDMDSVAPYKYFGIIIIISIIIASMNIALFPHENRLRIISILLNVCCFGILVFMGNRILHYDVNRIQFTIYYYILIVIILYFNILLFCAPTA
jgi:hypothetical protein